MKEVHETPTYGNSNNITNSNNNNIATTAAAKRHRKQHFLSIEHVMSKKKKKDAFRYRETTSREALFCMMVLTRLNLCTPRLFCWPPVFALLQTIKKSAWLPLA